MFFLLFLIPWGIYAQSSEILYLSGTGYGDTKTWDFFCSEGMNSKEWSKIEVPSQWELEGFGDYTYGRYYLDKNAKPSSETGLYKHNFEVPSTWKNKNVKIVFEGVMTDAEVKVNGKLAGPVHQGGFYEFSYDITGLLKFGKTNQLEVMVRKASANNSVNAAERKADWWLFGGIYRPVYLKAVPKTHIDHIAVNAKADGELTTEVHLKNVGKGYSLRTSITPLGKDNRVGEQISSLTKSAVQTVKTQWDDIKSWDPEHPNLYTLKLDLLDASGDLVHSYTERIGFRTVEFRPRDGIYVNGTKVILKGINRHSFHPEGGRTTSKQISLIDALLIKEMNMNAVRSHYPPDKHFLDVCDSVGLFYIDELAGWHDAYDDQVGPKLLKEMVKRDVNHPSVIIWSNGNEGGWNLKLDKLFAEYDPQKRHVIHPWADFNGLDTHHYPAYQTGVARLANGYSVFMPTEFLHGQYDKGHGAGLEDFWENYTSHPLFAGGFLWTYSDEAVVRTDKGGILDSDGPNGPDGIVGPRREKEGSFYTVREIWSPIQIKPLFITPSFNGEFRVSNEFEFTNLEECKMRYSLYQTPSPLNGGKKVQLKTGMVKLPAIGPGETGIARMEVPANFFEGDILELEAFDGSGRMICNWTWPVKFTDQYFAEQYKGSAVAGKASFTANNGSISLKANGVEVFFDEADGSLEKVMSNGKLIPLTNGPIPVGMRIKYKEGYTLQEGNEACFVAKYTGAVDSIVWRMTGDGLLGMDVVMLNKNSGGGFDGEFYEDEIYNFGFSFSFPEEEVTGMRWMGRGPYRVWKNRVKGTNYGIWQKDYNNTITGESYDQLIYPEFKGYHANLYWASIQSNGVPFTVYSQTDGVYFRVFTPQEPKHRRKGEDTMKDFPEGDLSFLLDIPAMRSFKPIPQHGPKSQPSSIRIKSGDEGIMMKLWFDFRS